MNNEDKELIKAYRQMREIYPNSTLMLINPNSYVGYNLQTGHKIKLVAMEYKEEAGDESN